MAKTPKISNTSPVRERTLPARVRTPKITPKIQRALDQAGEMKQRVVSDAAASKQPRFSIDPKDARKFFNMIYGVAKEAIFNEPPYVPKSERRDKWLAKVVRKEPYLTGILQSVVSIDKNRGFTMLGGKIQVKKFVNICHEFTVAPDLRGWRNGMSVTAQNYYQADLGAPVEIGRAGQDGPLAALYSVDPTKCFLTGNSETPLRYINGKTKESQDWGVNDYFRVASFPNPAEEFNGLGYCAVSRCMELAKLLVSVFEHDREQLGSKAPKGILTINGGLTLNQWLKSLEESHDELKTLEREYYSGVQVLVGDQGSDINVSLTSLSNLPEQFDHRQFLDMIMFGYALAFGYDPREFWPVSSGALGTATETENQSRRATSKGGLDFALSFQERFQDELPDTVQFEFQERDVHGDIAEAEFRKLQWDMINEMYNSVNAGGEELITRAEARQLLVDAKLIPDSWTDQEEDIWVTDTDDADLLDRQSVRRAMDTFPDEDIVMYDSNTNKYRTIFQAGERTFMIPVKKKFGQKERGVYDGDYDSIRAAYHDEVYTAVKGYLESSGRSNTYKNAMSRSVVGAFTPAVEQGYMDGGGELPMEDEVNQWLTAQQGMELANVDSLFLNLKALRDDGDFDAGDVAERHANGYANTLDGMYNKAVLYGAGNKMLTFDGDDGEHSCKDCTALKGQRHKASWWISHDYVPPSGSGLECAPGGHCEHFLRDDDGNQVTF